MTRSSTKGLVQPFEDPKSVFCARKKFVKATSLDSSSFLELDFVAEFVNQSEEETTTMEPTMEEYMTTTNAGYGLGVVRPKINKIVNFNSLCIRGLTFGRRFNLRCSFFQEPRKAVRFRISFKDRDLKYRLSRQPSSSSVLLDCFYP
ncbi:hypothetical protein Tco_0202469, partial [Tanacetum coccineum]